MPILRNYRLGLGMSSGGQSIPRFPPSPPPPHQDGPNGPGSLPARTASLAKPSTSGCAACSKPPCGLCSAHSGLPQARPEARCKYGLIMQLAIVFLSSVFVLVASLRPGQAPTATVQADLGSGVWGLGLGLGMDAVILLLAWTWPA